jgi:hypothetical protein
MQHPHIGMKVWEFDQNLRVYERDENGRAMGGPIWRKHWRELQVIGETSRSWLVGSEWQKSDPSRAMKIAKRDWPGDLAISEEDLDRRAFVEQRYKLARAIETCRDYDTLKAIEAALAAKPI